MLGVVLCGGQSTRMGSDKGLLKLHAATWAQTAVDKLLQLQLPIVISVNNDQYNNYSLQFKEEQLLVDNTTLQLKGPLCGVLSVHLKYPREDLFVLACDMLLMEPVLLKELLHHYSTSKKNGAYLFTNNNEPEPLCAVYTADALTGVHQLYLSNQLKRHSMKFAIEHMPAFFYPLTEEQKPYFQNFNAHAQLNGLPE